MATQPTAPTRTSWYRSMLWIAVLAGCGKSTVRPTGRGGGPGTIEAGSVEGGAVRGRQDPQVSMLAFIDVEARVPADHPLRVIRRLADEALERLLKASVLIALSAVRSERACCE
jgi:hypothetical protein